MNEQPNRMCGRINHTLVHRLGGTVHLHVTVTGIEVHKVTSTWIIKHVDLFSLSCLCVCLFVCLCGYVCVCVCVGERESTLWPGENGSWAVLTVWDNESSMNIETLAAAPTVKYGAEQGRTQSSDRGAWASHATSLFQDPAADCVCVCVCVCYVRAQLLAASTSALIRGQVND